MYRIILLAAVIFIGCTTQNIKTSDKEVLKTIKQYVENQDYFKLKAYYEKHNVALAKSHQMYYKAIIHNVFNNAEESNKAIELLLKEDLSVLDDTLMNEIYKIKIFNHVNLYEYADAASASKFVQENYSNLNDSVQLENLANEYKIWNALAGAPKQQIVKAEDVRIPMNRDKVGLFNIDVDINTITKNFIFDTGANFSVISKSLAEKMGIEIIDVDFFVTAATGKKVKSSLAIIDKLSIQGLVCRNAVFLVFDDEYISFPQIDYYVNGIIGFPIIEALDEIRINKENEITVPIEPKQYTYQNFALDGLMPIIAVKYENDTLIMHFDTGAASTTLYSPFYDKYKDEITQKYELQKFSSASASGAVEFEGYIVDSIILSVANSSATLQNLQLHKDRIGNKSSNFHGNFGQDYIKQFDEMIISFKSSSLLFK